MGQQRAPLINGVTKKRFCTNANPQKGKAPKAAPKFVIYLFDKDGEMLKKKLKINLGKAGVKFQQVKLATHGWRNKGNLPKYLKMEFAENE